MRHKQTISLIFCLLLFQQHHAQGNWNRFNVIDWKVQDIDASTPDSLAFKLTSSLDSEIEKVRAIYSWMTSKIAYNTGILKPSRNNAKLDFFELPDSVAWKPAHEMTAYQVLRRRVAVCEGYARLFKTLCEHAGISSEVVTGYANCCPGPVKFRTNHSWNAVRIDSSWYLVDVTWGSGYVDQFGNFVQRTDEKYFLANPSQFIRDHFPDDLRWTLLNEIPELHEFRRSPFMNKDYVKYSIGAWSHTKGFLETGFGDTLHLDLEIRDPQKDRQIASNSFFDSTVLTQSPASVFLEPELKGRKAKYIYVANDPSIEWIHLVYNGDIVLRYRLQFKKDRPGILQKNSVTLKEPSYSSL